MYGKLNKRNGTEGSDIQNGVRPGNTKKEQVQNMIADMHCDTLYQIRKLRQSGYEASFQEDEKLCVHLAGMKKSDYLVQNFAAYIDLNETENPYEDAMELVRIFQVETAKYSDVIVPAVSYGDILENRNQKKISALLTLEEGGICEGDLQKLHHFYDAGARMMTLCWNYENELAYPAAMQEQRDSLGLKEKGFVFLEEMESLGMIVDVSHLSDDGFYDVCLASKKPFAASHSNARALCDHPRNLSDDMIRKLGEHGGIAGLNFYPAFVTRSPETADLLTELVRHVQHMINLGGMECIGLGSDYDGFEGTGDPPSSAALDRLVWALHRSGMTEDEIDRIMYRNVLRLYHDTLNA